MSLISIILATVLSQGLGALWYSPLMFSSQWLKCVGKTVDDLTTSNLPYVVAMFSDLALAIITNIAIMYVNFGSALATITMVTVGVTVLDMALEAPHYAFEGRTLGLFGITVGHNIARIFMMASLMYVRG
ncbi:uncharacterized protein [Ptychodera flava]|uniref:uncharacterized protein n=1 Tax=Ptychodera flava TaxID=63121 RepID=UPI00396A96D4